MKYLVGAAALALAAPVFAQSSVSIYGIIDLDGQYLSGHSKQVLITSGGLSGSRLGFKGSEDLGGGNFAEFVLEGGLNIDTGTSGQGNSLFGRQAFGDLRTQVGTFSAGRQYSSIYTITGDFSIFSNVGVGPTTAVIGGFASGYEPVRGIFTANSVATGSSANGGPARVNNSFRYTSPSLSGFQASGLVGPRRSDRRYQRRIDCSTARCAIPATDSMPMLSYVNMTRDPAELRTRAPTCGPPPPWRRWAVFLDAFHIDAGYMKASDGQASEERGRQGLLGRRRLPPRREPVQAAMGPEQAREVGGLGQKTRRLRRRLPVRLLEAHGVLHLADALRQRGRGPGPHCGRLPTIAVNTLTVPGDTSVNEFVLGVRHSF